MFDETSQVEPMEPGGQGTAIREYLHRLFSATATTPPTADWATSSSFPRRTGEQRGSWGGIGEQSELGLTAATAVAPSSLLLPPQPDQLYVSDDFETRTREALEDLGAELLEAVSTWSELKG